MSDIKSPNILFFFSGEHTFPLKYPAHLDKEVERSSSTGKSTGDCKGQVSMDQIATVENDKYPYAG